jgi:hypothetical protein
VTPGRRRAAGLGLLVLLVAVSGCAVKRIENGVYHSSKGYRVTIPSGQWTPVDGSPADLELRHRGGSAGMAVNAVCEGGAPRRTTGVLTRQLLIGLRDRVVIGRGTVEVGGRAASRLVVEGRLEEGAGRVRVDTVVLKDGRCLYDFLLAAPPDGFDATRGDFERFADSFRME